MAQTGGADGNLESTHTTDGAASPKLNSFVQSLRHSLPTIGSGKESTTSTPAPKLLQEKLPWGNGGGDGDGQTATGAARLSQDPEGGAKGSCGSNLSGEGESGRDGGGSVRGGASDASAAAAVAAAAAELSAAALAASAPSAASETPVGPSEGTQAEEHLSCKYTKEELLARHWGMNLVQMKRVKALLRMGVCEEDLEIADRLLKMGR